MFTGENIGGVLNSGGNVLTTDGDKIGSIGRVYADDSSGDPTFVRVKTGLFGTSESFVPLEGARVEGNDILVPYSKEQVKDAPRVAEAAPWNRRGRPPLRPLRHRRRHRLHRHHPRNRSNRHRHRGLRVRG